MAGEKRKGEEQAEAGGSQASARALAPPPALTPALPCGQGRASSVVNRELLALESELAPPLAAGTLCGCSAYLLGLVLVALERKEAARAALVRACNDFPCNWSAWLALQPLCEEGEGAAALVARLGLRPHWMLDFFLASLYLELGEHAEALQRYEQLALAFPASAHVSSQRCVAQYGLKQFEEAAAGFEALTTAQPYRIEGLDIYSNILYVTEDRARLASLAHSAVRCDKYRAETCCVVGNYYSLRSLHDVAVQHFRRALRLDPSYLSAWTLMGHEFVEMRNTHAAVEAYRAAVQLSPRDYRAWYGLGQTYELLDLYLYALHYYERAAQLRPGDSRMWVAMGNCYDKMVPENGTGARRRALRCFRRAQALDPRDGAVLTTLSRMHEQFDELDEAAHFYVLNLQRMDEEELGAGEERMEACLFLATHARRAGRLDEAEEYAQRLLDAAYPRMVRERAATILREVRLLRVSDRSEERPASPMATSELP